MTDLTTIEQILHDGLLATFGDMNLVGLFGLLVYVLIAIFAGLNMSVSGMIFIPLVVIFAAYGLLDIWIAAALIMLGLFVVYLAWRKAYF